MLSCLSRLRISQIRTDSYFLKFLLLETTKRSLHIITQYFSEVKFFLKEEEEEEGKMSIWANNIRELKEAYTLGQIQT